VVIEKVPLFVCVYSLKYIILAAPIFSPYARTDCSMSRFAPEKDAIPSIE
jgi:hypothetical protein